MTDFDPSRLAELERDRQDNGQFGAKANSTPELSLFAASATAEETTYRVFADGEPVYTGAKGAGMSDALHQARVYLNDSGNAKPVVVIRSSADDGTGFAEVAVPYGDQGRIVGWYAGNAFTGEEMDEKGVSLSEFEQVSVEPYIDLGPHNEGDLPAAEQWVRDSDLGQVGTVYAKRDDETGGRHIDVDLHENFLWNADSRFPDDEADEGDERTPEERYEAWLDEHRDIVEEVYLEWFNADIDVPDTWESATITIRKTVPYERFTESLVIEDIYPGLADFKNKTDPGTWNSPYVMTEVWNRAEARDAEREAEASR
jgi:hypothetical protein